MADLTKLADILRAAGLKVVEIEGWKTRGRPGSFNPGGVLCHHTGGAGNGYADAKAMAVNGRPDLKPPLVQTALDRQGVWYVLAAGRANHAGRCKPVGGLKAYGDGRPYGDGNAQLIGVEAQNDGREAWPAVQYDSYVRGVAAITKAYGWRPPLGHKETSVEGKPDPHGIDMNQFRREVAATNPQEDDMPLTDDDIKRIWAYKVPKPGDGQLESAGSSLGKANVYSWRNQNDVDAIQAQVTGLSAAVGALASSQGVDPAVIAGIVDKAVRDRLAQIAVVDREPGQ